MSSYGYENQPVLEWQREPLLLSNYDTILVEQITNMDSRLKLKLHQEGFHELFPVQVCAWQQLCGVCQGIGPRYVPHDYFICAPTGSGKTLAYLLPLLQHLSRFPGHQLRAVVVLPSKDLANQVWEVSSNLCGVVNLNVCLLNGRRSVQEEFNLLQERTQDLLICTPARLTLHMNSSKGIAFGSLQFLVIDEGDKLLKQSFQDWLPRIAEEIEDLDRQQLHDHGFVYGQEQRVVKLLVSATLTRDPIKIQRLNLYNPRQIAADTEEGRYALPSTLEHYKVVCNEESKVVHIVGLLKDLIDQKEKVIVFTSSVDSTHQLWLLLSQLKGIFDKNDFVEYSGMLDPNKRATNLYKFRKGSAKVVLASDAMTRGIDVADVSSVVNYDMPNFVKTYVHRAGRTARAGRAGKVFTITPKPGQLVKVIQKIDNIELKKHNVDKYWIENNQQIIYQLLSTTQDNGNLQDSQENHTQLMQALKDTVQTFVANGWGIS